MAAMTREEVELLVADTVQAKVNQLLADNIEAKAEQYVTELFERKVKTEVERQVQESVLGLPACVNEGQKLLQRMMATLQRYAEQVPQAERICEALSKQVEPSHLQNVHDPSSPDGQTSLAPVLYRNIKYPDGPAAFNSFRLNVYDSPSTSASRVASLEFGALLPAAATQQVGQTLWLQLAAGATSSGQDLQNLWVQATLDDGTVQCAQVKGEGRPEPAEYAGQTFGRFYTEGFDGPQDAVVLSASGQAFWPTLNLTCMLRGIAMATVFERDWADGSEGFAAWVPYYAVNVYRFGLAGRKKRLFVTVKPTANWRRYAGPQGTWVPNAENVEADIGRAQLSECQWLFGMSRKLGFAWEDITFITTLSFMRALAKWTEDQCITECLLELERTHQDFHTLEEDEMERVFFAQLFSAEEALGFGDLQAELGVEPVVRKVARDPENPVPWSSSPSPKPDQVVRARDLLRDMLHLWTDAKKSYLKTLQELELQPADLTDLGILTNADRNVLHAVARKGQRRVLRAVLDELRNAKVLREWLTRQDQRQQTPLHAALAAQQRDSAAMLLEEVTASKQLRTLLRLLDADGLSLMHLAASAGNQEVVQSILDAKDLDWVTTEHLSRQNAEGKTLLDLCRHQESALAALLSVGMKFEEARRWLLRQLSAARRSADTTQAGYLGRLLQQPDDQGQQLIRCFQREDQREAFQDLAFSLPAQGLSLQVDYGVRKNLGNIVAKALDTSGTKGILQEVLQDLVVHGTTDTLLQLLRVGLGTTPRVGLFGGELACSQLQKNLDDALLGQMLETLHARGCLQHSELEALSKSSSLENLKELLHVVLVQFESKTILEELLIKLLPAMEGAGRLKEVLQALTPQGLGQVLSVELPKKFVSTAFWTAQARDCLQQVDLYMAKASSIRAINAVADVRCDVRGFVQAMQEAGRLEEVVKTSSLTTLDYMLRRGRDHATRVGLAAPVLAAGRFQEVARESLRAVFECIDSCEQLDRFEILGGIMTALRAEGLDKKVLEVISLSALNAKSYFDAYADFDHHGKWCAARIAAVHKAGDFKKVARLSSLLQLSCLVRFAQDACEGELLDNLMMAVRAAGRLEEVERRLRDSRLSA